MSVKQTTVFLALFLLLQLGTNLVYAGFCSQDSDCSETQCCLRYGGIVKICVKMSNELSEACGGRFLCPECAFPFKCFPHERTFTNMIKVGTGRCFLDR
ncbi:hypothetical protein CHUAL_010852 [Chamberlinius hualienensis]